MYWLQPAFWAQRWVTFNVPASVPYPTGTIDVITGSAFLRCLCAFVLGMFTYEIYTLDLRKKVFIQYCLQSGWLFCAIWILLIVLWHFNYLLDPIAVVFFCLLILTLTRNNDWLIQRLNNRFLTYLGEISYSLYLVHMPILFSFILYRKLVYVPDLLETPMLGYFFTLSESWFGLLGFMASTFLLSALSYRYLENPARRYLNAPVKKRVLSASRDVLAD